MATEWSVALALGWVDQGLALLVRMAPVGCAIARRFTLKLATIARVRARSKQTVKTHLYPIIPLRQDGNRWFLRSRCDGAEGPISEGESRLDSGGSLWAYFNDSMPRARAAEWKNHGRHFAVRDGVAI